MKSHSFSYEKMGTKTRFEEEAKGNSEMAYIFLSLIPHLAQLMHLMISIKEPFFGIHQRRIQYMS